MSLKNRRWRRDDVRIKAGVETLARSYKTLRTALIQKVLSMISYIYLLIIFLKRESEKQQKETAKSVAKSFKDAEKQRRIRDLNRQEAEKKKARLEVIRK